MATTLLILLAATGSWQAADIRALVERALSTLPANAWVYRVLRAPASPVDEAMPAAVDEPVQATAAPRRLSWLVHTVLTEGQSCVVAPNADREERRQGLRRYLFRRTPFLIRWLPGVPEYASPMQPSGVVKKYRAFEDAWTDAEVALTRLQADGGTPSQIAAAERRAGRARYKWETRGRRRLVASAQQQWRALTTSQATVWDEIDEVFHSGGGTMSAMTGQPGPWTIDDASRVWHPDTIFMNGQTHAIEWTLGRIVRPWLDDRVLVGTAFRWSPSSPWVDRESNDWFPNFVEGAVLVREPGSSSVDVVALFGESVPRIPQTCGTESPYDAPGSAHRRADLLGRLRNRSF